jgi:hypothetical protein
VVLDDADALLEIGLRRGRPPGNLRIGRQLARHSDRREPYGRSDHHLNQGKAPFPPHPLT